MARRYRYRPVAEVHLSRSAHLQVRLLPHSYHLSVSTLSNLPNFLLSLHQIFQYCLHVPDLRPYLNDIRQNPEFSLFMLLAFKDYMQVIPRAIVL